MALHGGGIMSTTVDGQVYTRAPVPVTLIAPTGTLSAYPALIILTPNATVYNASNSLLSDWRFTANSDGSGLLYHQYMSGTNAAGNAMFWVNVTTLTTGTNIIYLWYGASGQTQQTTAWQANTWNANYGAVWHFEETGTNPQIKDATSHANNSTSGAWTPGTGKLGGGAGFSSASSQHIVVADSTTLRSAAAITISAWVKFTVRNASAGLFTKGTGTDNNGLFDGFLDSSGKINFGVQQAAMAGWVYAITAAITDANWHYMVAKYDGAHAIIKLDDTKVIGAAYSGLLYQSTQPLNIGSLYSTTWLLNGGVDELRIESDATSDAWDTYSYNTMSSAAGAVSSVTWPSAGMTAQQMARGMF
jgi:biopolymer transport protein ExbB